MQGGTLNCQGFPCKQKLFPLLAPGGAPGVIQRRGVGRRNGEMHKAAAESGVPGFCFTPFMFFMVCCIFRFRFLCASVSPCETCFFLCKNDTFNRFALNDLHYC